MEYTLALTDSPDEELRQIIVDKLVTFNTSVAGPAGNKVLAISLKDGRQNCVGGLYGRTHYGWLFIELIYVPQSMRGHGLGKKLLEMAEKEAIRRGCCGIWLDTFEFQARQFYEKCGFQVFGKLPNYPSGNFRYFLNKILSP